MATSEQDKSLLLPFVISRSATFERWKKRSMRVAYAGSAVAYLIALFALYKAAPEFSYSVPVAAIGAIIGFAFMMFVVIPRLPMPSLRCPFCSERVPLVEPPRFMQALTPLKKCPNCQHDLWA
jgi:hypothetical protein